MRAMLALLTLLIPLQAAAQNEPMTYNSADFSVTLPAGGMVADPASDPDWDEEPETLFYWVSVDGESPLAMVMGRVDELGEKVTAFHFAGVFQGMLEELKENHSSFTVLESDPNFMLEGRRWGKITVHDPRDDSWPYYTFYTTYSGERVYTLVVYFVSEPTPEAMKLAEQIPSSVVFADRRATEAGR